MTKFAIILLLSATDSRPPGAIPHTVRADALSRGQREGSSVAPAHAGSTIRVPRGAPVKIDGHVDSKEWDDAATVNIKFGRDWKSAVRIKHDDLFLYFLFDGLKRGGQRLFPEILIDPRNRKGDHWEKGQWWFHVSANLCEGNGEPNVYKKDGVFQCAHHKEGWAGNNPPATGSTITEIRVSFAKLGIRAAPGLQLGTALALTNATGNNTQKWFLWPRDGRIESPATWGVAVLE